MLLYLVPLDTVDVIPAQVVFAHQLHHVSAATQSVSAAVTAQLPPIYLCNKVGVLPCANQNQPFPIYLYEMSTFYWKT